MSGVQIPPPALLLLDCGMMERQELERLIRERHSIRRIADAAGVSPTTIRYWLGVWGMKSNGNRTRRHKPLCRNCGRPVKQKPNVYCSISCQMQFKRRVKVEGGTAGKRALRSYLIECREYRCEVCGLAEWMGKPIQLELDNKDGDLDNNQLDNIKLICLYCKVKT